MRFVFRSAVQPVRVHLRHPEPGEASREQQRAAPLRTDMVAPGLDWCRTEENSCSSWSLRAPPVVHHLHLQVSSQQQNFCFRSASRQEVKKNNFFLSFTTSQSILFFTLQQFQSFKKSKNLLIRPPHPFLSVSPPGLRTQCAHADSLTRCAQFMSDSEKRVCRD